MHLLMFFLNISSQHLRSSEYDRFPVKELTTTAAFVSLWKDKGRIKSKLFLLKSWINWASLMMSEFLALRPNSKFALKDWFPASAFNVCSTFLFPKQGKKKWRKEKKKRKERGRRRWFRFNFNLAFICIFKLVKLWTVAKQWQRIFVIISLLGV